MSERVQDYVKVMLTYDIHPDNVERYHEFMLQELVPKAQALGLGMVEAWHTAVGDYPVRLIAFVVENQATATSILESDEWLDIEDELLQYVTNYNRRLVPLRDRFQF